MILGVFTKLSDYVLGEDVAGLEIKGEAGHVISTPSWQLILSYEHEVRKKAYRLVADGIKLAEAFKKAIENAILK